MCAGILAGASIAFAEDAANPAAPSSDSAGSSSTMPLPLGPVGGGASEASAPAPLSSSSSDLPPPGSSGPLPTASPSATAAPPPPTAIPPSSSSSSAAMPPPPSTSIPPSAFMPPAPTPLPDQTLQNAVRTEAEQNYYDRQRKRLSDTFERAYEGLVPLGPNEVRDVMGRYERTQKSSVPPAAGQPRGQVRIKTLQLEPGGDPPTVNVASGYVTTITILDATGQPWPIIDLGVGGNFEVTKTGAGNGGTHVVRIMPLTRFGYGNLSLILQDLSTPIIFKLAAGGSTVDYRFDGRVPRLGPNAKLSLIERRQLQAGSALIMSFLDNSPPPDAKRIRLAGADARTIAWTINDRMFVRTPLAMLSPSWDASVSSADGTTVYELNETPVLLMSDGGALIRARVIAQKED
ncbi:MAG: hypothetical protein HY053_00155 [Proteobacteria bacterium]|nr:hypothetical protein [Pseudomonadota bacterium]